MRLVIVGAGVAGVAAAAEARGALQAGGARADVTLVHAAPAASALGVGAFDLEPWEDLEPLGEEGLQWSAGPSLPPEVAALARALGAVIPEGRLALVATLAGRLRPARATDGALLDLSALDGLVLLPRAERARWDADVLAASLSSDPLAARRGLRFAAFDAAVLRTEPERTASDVDLARAADAPERLAWLGARLADALRRAPPAAAVLLGPWLGAQAPRAAALSAAAGLPCGEALVGAGSPAGRRFEASRDALLERLGVTVVRGRVRELLRRSSGLGVALEDGRSFDADGVVLAIGGPLSGALRYTPPEAGAGADAPPSVGPSFTVSIAGVPPPDLPHAGPAPVGVTSSLSGLSLEGRVWRPARGEVSILEAVGVDPRDLPEGLAVAGDCALGIPRTFLAAAASGVHAARRLLRPQRTVSAGAQRV